VTLKTLESDNLRKKNTFVIV